MPKLIHSKYGYETPEWTAADARLEKWLKDKKEREWLKRVMDKRIAENK
ncbi:hypothetical protein [Latilactobacillus sakei]|nr:hypothetical protein [Latilactobacillus sakei]